MTLTNDLTALQADFDGYKVDVAAKLHVIVTATNGSGSVSDSSPLTAEIDARLRAVTLHTLFFAWP